MDTMLKRLERLEGAARAAECRARAWQLAATVLFVLGLALLPLKMVTAKGGGSQAGGLPALAARVKTLETTVADQKQKIAALQAALASETAARIAADTALQNQVTPLAAKLEKISIQQIDGYYSIVIDGANVHVRNGLGAYTTNGLGNLVLGYNTLREPLPFLGADVRTGSHNLVVGDQQNYASFGGIVVGQVNSILAPYASVSGGYFNTAGGSYAAVSGGLGNTAAGEFASVSGGQDNTASNSDSSVSGGVGNTASGAGSSVSGGGFRSAPGPYDWAAGGLFQDQ